MKLLENTNLSKSEEQRYLAGPLPYFIGSGSHPRISRMHHQREVLPMQAAFLLWDQI